MAKRLTDADKIDFIEKMIAVGREKPAFTFWILAKQFPERDGNTYDKWIRQLFGKSATKLFIERGAVMSEEQKNAYMKIAWETLKDRYNDKEPEEDYKSLKAHNPDIDFYAAQVMCEESGLISHGEWYFSDYLSEVGILKKKEELENKKPMSTAPNKSITTKQLEKNCSNCDEQMRLIKIYQNMSNMDITALITEAGNTKCPANKDYKVMYNGKEFHVKTSWPRRKQKFDNYFDAYSAIETMLSVEEVQQKWIDLDPNMHSDAAYFITSPEFDPEKCVELDEVETKRRMDFIMAVANLLDDEQTMEAIIQAAEKKKNGSLYKGRVLKIGSSGVACGSGGVYAIVGCADNDYEMTVTCRVVSCKPGDNEKWECDFISTPHEGLRITESLRKLEN